MLNNYKETTLFEGADVRCCLWNIFLEQLGCSDEQLIKQLDKPATDFNHLQFFKALEHGLVSVEQLEGDCVQMVLTN